MTTIKHRYIDGLLREDRLPHIWCPGCAIGTTLNSFLRAVEKSKIDSDHLHVVSGIGCTGRVAGYVNVDSFHTTHGRAIPFATGLSLARPSSKVVVYSGDGDLTAIGGNHLIHAARRNMDMVVICVNNYTYGMTGGQVTPTTPEHIKASTAPYGNFEYSFNLPALVDAAGATFIARWTAYHVRQMTRTMVKALNHKGFSFIEILSPCPTLYMRRNKMGSGVEMLKEFKDQSVIRNGEGTARTDLDFLESNKIIVGEFVEKQRPTFAQGYKTAMESSLGESFVPYEGKQ